MSTEDTALTKYQSLEPRTFPVVSTFSLEQPIASLEGITVVLKLRPADPAEGRRLKLTFYKVVDLFLKQELSEISFSLLAIESLRERHLEGLNYRVIDVEEGSLSFLCAAFDAAIEEVP